MILTCPRACVTVHRENNTKLNESYFSWRMHALQYIWKATLNLASHIDFDVHECMLYNKCGERRLNGLQYIWKLTLNVTNGIDYGEHALH